MRYLYFHSLFFPVWSTLIIWMTMMPMDNQPSCLLSIHAATAVKPTGQPTREPSNQPTSKPSIPTSQPSRQPSSKPSAPSSRPTSHPSSSSPPSKKPVMAPTVPNPLANPGVLAGVIIGSVGGAALLGLCLYFLITTATAPPTPPVTYMTDGKWPVNRAVEKGWEMKEEKDTIPPETAVSW